MEIDYCSLTNGGKKSQYSLDKAGKNAIFTNARKKPQAIFELCKLHNDVVESFDVFKNLQIPDTAYLSDDDTLRGIFSYCSFHSLRITASSNS